VNALPYRLSRRSIAGNMPSQWPSRNQIVSSTSGRKSDEGTSGATAATRDMRVPSRFFMIRPFMITRFIIERPACRKIFIREDRPDYAAAQISGNLLQHPPRAQRSRRIIRIESAQCRASRRELALKCRASSGCHASLFIQIVSVQRDPQLAQHRRVKRIVRTRP